MEKNNEVIQTHPLVGWDISTVDSYDALMLRLHYQNPTQENSNAGIAKIESGEYQENEYRRH